MKKYSGEIMYYIYGDVFLLLNIIVNSLILQSASWMLGISCGWRKLFSSALAGAIINWCYLIFQIRVPGAQIITAVLMAYLAFHRSSVKEKSSAVFLLLFLAFSMEGAIAWGEMTTAAIMIPAVSFWIGRERKRRSLELDVVLTFRGKSKKMKGFFDTGNCLLEPMTGKMVHIAYYEEVKELLPETYRQAAEYYFKTGLLEDTKVTELQMYEFTFLSYHSIGNETGQLLGIRMDSAYFKSKSGEKTEEKPVIGLANQKLFVRGHGRMIINGRLEL